MVTYSKINNVIEINKEEYFKLYNEIVKTCLTDGYLLSGLLEAINVPKEYDFDEETGLVMSKESYSKRFEMEVEMELKYNNIDVPFSDQKAWSQEYIKIQNEELLNFVSAYPQFEKILK